MHRDDVGHIVLCDHTVALSIALPSRCAAAGRIDTDRGGWIVTGRWGRTNDPDRKGGFEFVFGSPCRFTGSWWYGEADESTVGTAWSGECK